MTLIVICVAALALALIVGNRIKRSRERRELERHCIGPEMLHDLLNGKPPVLLFDVRQPLDLLAKSEMIPGAKRIPPKDILENPALIPREQDTVVYCTCPGEKTSRDVLRHALGLHYSRLRLLRGGLEGWKAKGYPVEPYRESFRLDTPA